MMMAAAERSLRERQQFFFRFLGLRLLWGTGFSAAVIAVLLLLDPGGMRSLMMRSPDSWIWLLILSVGIWVTVTGITVSIAIMYIGDWRDPPEA